VGSDVDIYIGYMLLQVTQEFCPPCIGSAKVLTFFLFFCGHFSAEKRKETKMRMFFRPKNKTPKNFKKCVFWRRKIKRKRNSVGFYISW